MRVCGNISPCESACGSWQLIGWTETAPEQGWGSRRGVGEPFPVQVEESFVSSDVGPSCNEGSSDSFGRSAPLFTLISTSTNSPKTDCFLIGSK